jgi:DNA primase
LSSSGFTERVKREVSLDVFISRYVKLKKAGKRFTGLCPFHSEKSPSFTVSPELGFYHCFGCGKSGDIFTFVQEIEKVDFRRALEILSDYSGIPLEQSSKPSDQKEKEALYALNDEYLAYYRRNLKGEEGKFAREYLASRGIGESDQERFELGYALPGFENTIRSLLFTPDKVKMALTLGLIKKREKGQGSYDFFRDRIIFPIRDSSGKVAGFGGRVFKDTEEAKYINSPQSLIYDKGKMFYGLLQAQNWIRKHRKAILVEGYLDVIGFHSKEIDYAVAPLGTALTPYQVRSLRSMADSLLVCFDGDRAGRRAALRAVEICFKENLSSQVVLLPEGKDPFDLSQELSKHEIFEILNQSKQASDFILSETLQGVDRSSGLEEKRKAIQNLFQFLKGLENDSDRQMFLQTGAKNLGLEFSVLWEDFKKGTGISFTPKEVDTNKKEVYPKRVLGKLEKIERGILAKLLLHPFLWDSLNLEEGVEFQDSESALLWSFLYQKYMDSEEIGPSLLASLPESVQMAIASFLLDSSEMMDAEPDAIEANFKDLWMNYQILKIETELKMLQSNLNSTMPIEEILRKTSDLKNEKMKLEIQLRNSKGN